MFRGEQLKNFYFRLISLFNKILIKNKGKISLLKWNMINILLKNHVNICSTKNKNRNILSLKTYILLTWIKNSSQMI